MKKDFTANSKERVIAGIEEATTPAAAPETNKRKRYKDRREYSEEEAAELRATFKSSGRKGIKLRRVNLAVSDENYEYIRIMSRARGETYSEFLNWMMQTHRDENIATYLAARSFIENM